MTVSTQLHKVNHDFVHITLRLTAEPEKGMEALDDLSRQSRQAVFDLKSDARSSHCAW